MNADILFSSKDETWRTPKWLCRIISDFYQADFLDPAAPLEDVSYTGAARVFTTRENGLVQPWRGRVYLNSPYGRNINIWVDKFLTEYENGHMIEGLILVPARTETKWWCKLVMTHPFIFFFYGRLRFDGADNAAPFPSALVYLGERTTQLKVCLSQLGWSARVTSI